MTNIDRSMHLGAILTAHATNVSQQNAARRTYGKVTSVGDASCSVVLDGQTLPTPRIPFSGGPPTVGDIVPINDFGGRLEAVTPVSSAGSARGAGLVILNGNGSGPSGAAAPLPHISTHYYPGGSDSTDPHNLGAASPTDVTTSMNNHLAAANPHSQYLLLSGGAMSGTLTLNGGLTVNSSTVFNTTPEFARGATIDMGQTLNFGTDVTLTRRGANVLGMGPQDSLESNTYTSNITGWHLGDSYAEFGNIIVRGEIKTAVFTKSLISAHAGTLIIGVSAGVLAVDMVVPTSGTWIMTVNNPPGGGFLFTSGDICRVRAVPSTQPVRSVSDSTTLGESVKVGVPTTSIITGATDYVVTSESLAVLLGLPPSGNLSVRVTDSSQATESLGPGFFPLNLNLIGDVWFTVGSGTDNNNGTQSYTCTYASGYRNAVMVYPAGSGVVDYGVSGQGLLLMTADLAGAPYYSVQTHAGSPWSATTERVRLGNLTGVLGLSNQWGLAAGVDLSNNTQPYIVASSSQVSLSNVDLTISGASADIALGNPAPTAWNSGTGVWMDNGGLALVSSNTDIVDLGSNGLTFLETAPGGVPKPNIRWYQGFTSRGTYNGYVGRIEMSSGFLANSESLQIEVIPDQSATRYAEVFMGVQAAPPSTGGLGMRNYAWWDPAVDSGLSASVTWTGMYGSALSSGKTMMQAKFRTFGATAASASATNTLGTLTLQAQLSHNPPAYGNGSQYALPASTEMVDYWGGFNRTVTWPAGSFATQRAFVLNPPTYAFGGASTITDAATLAIVGAPIAGTNATLTNSHALWVQGGQTTLEGGLNVGTANGAGAGQILIAGSNTLGVNYISTSHAYMKVDSATASQAGYYLYQGGVQKAAVYTTANDGILRFYVGADRLTIDTAGVVYAGGEIRSGDIIRARTTTQAFSSQSATGVANAGGTATFNLGSTNFIGLLVVVNVGGQVGLFTVGYNNVSNELYDPSNVYSPTSGTASMSNVYVTGGTLTIQNNTATTPQSYFCTFIGYAP